MRCSTRTLYSPEPEVEEQDLSLLTQLLLLPRDEAQYQSCFGRINSLTQEEQGQGQRMRLSLYPQQRLLSAVVWRNHRAPGLLLVSWQRKILILKIWRRFVRMLEVQALVSIP
jgi:hypothetical protein